MSTAACESLEGRSRNRPRRSGLSIAMFRCISALNNLEINECISLSNMRMKNTALVMILRVFERANTDGQKSHGFATSL